MNKRSENMKKVVATRSAEVKAMLDLITDLDQGKEGELDGFRSFGIKYNEAMKDRINSYRAKKIANYLGKNISKSHLVKFSKHNNLSASHDLTHNGKQRISIDEFLNINSDALAKYYSFIKSLYINDALLKLENNKPIK